MAIPVIFSLLALLKIELASGLEISNRIAHALSAVNKQLTFLNAREDLDIPLDKLLVRSAHRKCPEHTYTRDFSFVVTHLRASYNAILDLHSESI